MRPLAVSPEGLNFLLHGFNGLQGLNAQVLIPALLFAGCVTLGKVLKLSVLQFALLQRR